VRRAAIPAVPVSAVSATVMVPAPGMSTGMSARMSMSMLMTTLLMQGQDRTSIFYFEGTDHLALRLAPEILFGGEFDDRCNMIARNQGSLAFKAVPILACYLSAFEELYLLNHHYLGLSQAY
jgi:hypothetical protein